MDKLLKIVNIVIVIIFAYDSCNEKTVGVHSIKLGNGRKFRTSYLYDNLPEYQPGDSVSVFENSEDGEWYILPHYLITEKEAVHKAVIIE